MEHQVKNLYWALGKSSMVYRSVMEQYKKIKVNSNFTEQSAVDNS